MPLVRILYRSDSQLTGADRAVRESAFQIAEHAAARNAEDGVTGALMFVGGVFVQVLEGEPADVERVFERICRDLRHRRLVVLDYSEIGERVFSAWSMVAFEGDGPARELFPGVSEATPFARRNRMSANRAVDMMRALLRRREAKVRKAPDERMIATDILA